MLPPGGGRRPPPPVSNSASGPGLPSNLLTRPVRRVGSSFRKTVIIELRCSRKRVTGSGECGFSAHDWRRPETSRVHRAIEFFFTSAAGAPTEHTGLPPLTTCLLVRRFMLAAG